MIIFDIKSDRSNLIGEVSKLHHHVLAEGQPALARARPWLGTGPGPKRHNRLRSRFFIFYLALWPADPTPTAIFHQLHVIRGVLPKAAGYLPPHAPRRRVLCGELDGLPSLSHHLFLFRNYDVLDQKVWAVALCRELPSPAWRGASAADIKVPLARSARVKVPVSPPPKG